MASAQDHGEAGMSGPQQPMTAALAAELIARHINTAFSNACGYGMRHPMTQRAVNTAHEALADGLESEPMMTLLLDRGSLFLDKHPVGKRFNPRQLINTFTRIGLESISFEASIGKQDLEAVIAALSGDDRIDSVEDMSRYLDTQSARGVRLNYVVYRQVTSDQQVVSGDGSGGDGGTLSRSIEAIQAMAEETDGEGLKDSDEESRRQLIAHLRSLARDIERGAASAEIPARDLLAAMTSLRKQVQATFSVSEDVGRILAEEQAVIDEVDELTYSTLVNLLREEYRGGNFETRRMAQIIHRMLPDPKEIHQLLPRLKEGLVEEGMSLNEFAELVHELSAGFRGEHLVGALEQGADRVGVGLDEVLGKIEDDPTEAARLIVLAAELREGGVPDDEQLSRAFEAYIERIGEQLDLGGRSEHGQEAIRQQLGRVRSELVDELRKRGLADESAEQIDGALEERLRALLDDQRLDVLAGLLERSGQLSADEVLRRLQQEFDSIEELERLEADIRELMNTHGFSAEQISEMLSELTRRLASGEQPPAMPGEVLSTASTAMFLKREIMTAQRYETPFSVLKLLIERLKPDNAAARVPERSELAWLLPQLYQRLIKQARELDLIGSLERTQRAVPLLILPMTPQSGAEIVRARIERLLEEFPFRIGDDSFFVEATITALGFDRERDTDGDAFLSRLNLQQRQDRLKRQARQSSAPPARRASG
jgi:hypothetical protein